MKAKEVTYKMGDEKVKKVIDWLGWISVFFTIIALFLTWLTTYSFTTRFQRYFGGYSYPYLGLQLCMSFTMFVWSIRFLSTNSEKKSLIYTLLFMLIAAGSIFFALAKLGY